MATSLYLPSRHPPCDCSDRVLAIGWEHVAHYVAVVPRCAADLEPGQPRVTVIPHGEDVRIFEGTGGAGLPGIQNIPVLATPANGGVLLPDGQDADQAWKWEQARRYAPDGWMIGGNGDDENGFLFLERYVNIGHTALVQSLQSGARFARGNAVGGGGGGGGKDGSERTASEQTAAVMKSDGCPQMYCHNIAPRCCDKGTTFVDDDGSLIQMYCDKCNIKPVCSEGWKGEEVGLYFLRWQENLVDEVRVFWRLADSQPLITRRLFLTLILIFFLVS